MRSRRWIRIDTRNSAFTALAVAAVVTAVIAAPHVAQARPWSEHTQSLAAHFRQIEVGEHEMHELLEEKHHSHDPKRVAAIMKQIDETQRAVMRAAREYEEERQHVRFEHPEKNDQLDHTYVRHEVKSIEDMENELGVDARLDRAKARALAKFPIPEKKITAAEAEFRTRLPASQPAVPDEDAPEKVKLVK